MTVYVDEAIWPWRGNRWAHLVADDVDELHAFAECIGLRRSWFQSAAHHPHYDVTEQRRKRAIHAGAVPVTRREMALIIRRLKATQEKVAEIRRMPQKSLWSGLPVEVE